MGVDVLSPRLKTPSGPGSTSGDLEGQKSQAGSGFSPGQTSVEGLADRDGFSAGPHTNRTRDPEQTAHAKPTRQRGRSRSNCDCGGPCFYCGRTLSASRHEHDHFPIPWRHGGEDTVPTCRECHSLKDRVGFGVHQDGSPDEHILSAIDRGMKDLPHVIDGRSDRSVPLMVYLLFELVADAQDDDEPLGWRGDLEFVDDIERISQNVVWAAQRCANPEAKIWLARTFAFWLDLLNDKARAAGAVAS